MSFQIAKALGMPWHVRFEDIDKIRVIPGAVDGQLRDLKRLGLEPDQVIFQTDREERHWELFARGVLESGKIYPCYCSAKGVRRELEEMASAANAPVTATSAPSSSAPLYTGHCRNLTAPQKHQLPSVGWRFRSRDPSGKDDFLVARSGPEARIGVLPSRQYFASAYHWACAIDDFDGGYAVIVRAWDLEPAARLQRQIREWAEPGRARPANFHSALVVAQDGSRLEKRTRGITLDELENQGISPGRLLEAFERSFAFSKGDIVPGETGGEKARSICLNQLIPEIGHMIRST